MKTFDTKKLIVISLLSSICAILTFFSINLPIFPSYLKIDISDIPAMIGASIYGPIAGIYVQLIKNIFGYISNSQTMGIGEFANFVIGSAYIIPIGIFCKKDNTFKNFLLASLVGTILMTIVACIINYLVVFPLYIRLSGYKIENIIDMSKSLNSYIDSYFKVFVFTIVPYNIVKGILNSIVGCALFKFLNMHFIF